MLPRKMQSRSRMQPERPWLFEPGLLVGRKVHQSSGSVNPANNQACGRRQLRRSGPTQVIAPSFAAPLIDPDAPLYHARHSHAARRPQGFRAAGQGLLSQWTNSHVHSHDDYWSVIAWIRPSLMALANAL